MDFENEVIVGLILLIGSVALFLAVRRFRSMSNKNFVWHRKIAECMAVMVLVAPFIALAVSTICNAVVGVWFRITHPEPGESYLVNSRRLHINCIGTGSPTIILDAGAGDDSLIWGGIQPVLSKTTRVCAYDRAGLGLSDSVPTPRDADHIAEELHELLIEAKATDHVVLMGHSIAGMYIRDYASRYPADVVGLIFLDSVTPLQEQNPAIKAMDSTDPLQWLWDLRNRVEFITGLPRFEGQCSHAIPGFDPSAARLESEDSCRDHLGAVKAETDNLHRSGLETVHAGPYGALPILIFSHDPTKSLRSGNPQQRLVEVERVWNVMQENLKRLSTRSQRIIAKDGDHYLMISRADLIEKEVPIWIEQIRGLRSQPSNYQSTITE